MGIYICLVRYWIWCGFSVSILARLHSGGWVRCEGGVGVVEILWVFLCHGTGSIRHGGEVVRGRLQASVVQRARIYGQASDQGEITEPLHFVYAQQLPSIPCFHQPPSLPITPT